MKLKVTLALAAAVVLMSSASAYDNPPYAAKVNYPAYKPLPASAYPAGSTAKGIAENEAQRKLVAGTPGILYCYLIDTKTGKCTRDQVMDAGGAGGSGGGDAGSAGAGAGGSGGK